MNAAAVPGWHVILAAGWLGGFMAVHPLPHTGALRSLLLLAGLVQVGILLWQRRPLRLRWHGRAEGVLLAVLTAWLLVQSATLAAAPAMALGELAREWGKLLAMVALGLGLAAALRASADDGEAAARGLLTGLFVACFVHVLMVLGYQAWQLAGHGRLVPGEGASGNYGYVSLLVNAALALQLADAAERLCRRRRLLPIGWAAAVAALAATLLANAVLTSKAGLIMTHLLAWTFLVAILRHGTAHRPAVTLAVIAGLAAATAASVAVEDRWSGAVGAIAAGAAGATAPPPAAAAAAPDVPAIRSPIRRIDGQDPSFFFRSSWAKIGVQGIGEHPAGLGYGADAFGRYVAQRFGVTGFVSSHSGWLDFTLANGIPAMLLLAALATMLAWRGWLGFRRGRVAGLALGLLVINYFGRCVMDGYLSGSRLTGFALVAAVLWGLAAETRTADDAGPA